MTAGTKLPNSRNNHMAKRRSYVLKCKLKSSGIRKSNGRGFKSNLSTVQEKDASFEKEGKVKETGCRSPDVNSATRSCVPQGGRTLE